MVSREVDACQLQETPSLTSFINATVTGQILRPQLQRFSSFILGLNFSTLPWQAANYFLLCRRWQTASFYSIKTGV